MKTFTSVFAVVAVAAASTAVSAGERFALRPVSGPALFAAPSLLGQQDLPPAPIEEGAAPMPIPAGGPAIPLFHCVEYKDLDEMHPCAVPKIIAVKDPCACDDPCNCCGPKCVYIKICVPPCGCERIKSNRKGTRISYDYGEYEVDVRVKDGHIEVDYQD